MGYLLGRRTLVILAALMAAPGCARHRPTHPAASTRPSPSPSQSSSAFTSTGIQLTLPAQWERRTNPDYVLALAPVGASDEKQGSISLDIPQLPPHIPGMIPIGSVHSGYLDDLRKQFPDLQSQDQTPPTIGQAKVRFARSTWHALGNAFVESALMMVHDDHVYILRGRSDAAHEAATRKAFDDIAHSIQWSDSKPSSRPAGSRTAAGL